jgi:NADH:ubiquinone oxidoreductase subunit E
MVANTLVQLARGERVTLAMVQEAAARHAVSLEQAYAALAFNPQLVFDFQCETLLACCVGGCQAQGALDNLRELLRLRAERLAAGRPSFDIVPRTCLDMCAHAPVCLSRSQHGQAAHPRLKPADLPGITEALCS